MIDDKSKISDYEGKRIFLLNNTDQSSDLVVNEGRGIVKLNLPYIIYANRFFYLGDKGDVSSWGDFEFDPSSWLQDEAFMMVKQAGNEMGEYLDELKYESVDYSFDENRIEIKAEPGFILVKDSYFPYWSIEKGRILSTSQGFMLINTDDNSVLLSYRKPIINTIATIISVISLLFTFAVLISYTFRRRDMTSC